MTRGLCVSRGQTANSRAGSIYRTYFRIRLFETQSSSKPPSTSFDNINISIISRMCLWIRGGLRMEKVFLFVDRLYWVNCFFLINWKLELRFLVNMGLNVVGVILNTRAYIFPNSMFTFPYIVFIIIYLRGISVYPIFIFLWYYHLCILSHIFMLFLNMS